MVGNGPPPPIPPASDISDSEEAPSGMAHPVSMPEPPSYTVAITVAGVTTSPTATVGCTSSAT